MDVCVFWDIKKKAKTNKSSLWGCRPGGTDGVKSQKSHNWLNRRVESLCVCASMLNESKMFRGRIWRHRIVGRARGFLLITFFFAFILFYFSKSYCTSFASLLRHKNKQTNKKKTANARKHQRLNQLTSSHCSWMWKRKREIKRVDVSTVNRRYLFCICACFSSLPPLAAWIWMEEVLVCLISTDEPNQPRRRRLSESQLRRID